MHGPDRYSELAISIKAAVSMHRSNRMVRQNDISMLTENKDMNIR